MIVKFVTFTFVRNCLSLCLSVGVCESYIVHHLVSTGIRCELPGCVVHHQAALCTMVHKGDLCPLEEGVAPYTFHCLVVHKEHAQYGHFFPGRITTSIQKWCTSTHIFYG